MCKTKGVDDLFVTTDINTLLTALYVKIDDWLVRPRRWASTEALRR